MLFTCGSSLALTSSRVSFKLAAMLKTRKLNLGDLVAVNYGTQLRVGMIYHFNEAYTSYKIQWFGKQLPDTTCGWITAQEYRNIFLDRWAQLL